MNGQPVVGAVKLGMMAATGLWLLAMSAIGGTLLGRWLLGRNDIWEQTNVIAEYGVISSEEYINRSVVMAVALAVGIPTPFYAIAMISLLVVWFAFKR